MQWREHRRHVPAFSSLASGKATGAWSEALRRLKTTSTAGEGGPVSQKTPQDGLQSLSDGTVNIRRGLADVGGRTGENDIGREGSLQMRVAHLVQQHQRLLELGNPALEHLFTEGGRANRADKEREPLTGDRDLRWQWGERRNAALAGQRGGTCLRRGGGTEGPSLSTMWSAAERSPGGPTRKPN